MNNFIELILSGKPLIIDKNSPENLSARDRPVFLEHQELLRKYPGWIPPEVWKPWYNGKYLKTDHWMFVREIISKYWDYKCSECSEFREPKYVHHRDREYKCLWKEQLNDVVYNCEICHQIVHSRWPDRENDSKLRRFVGVAVMKIASNASRKRIEKLRKNKKSAIFWNRLSNRCFDNIASKCQSRDEEKRKSAFFSIGKMTLIQLDFEYGYSEDIKNGIRNYLIHLLHYYVTVEKKDFDDSKINEKLERINESKEGFIATLLLNDLERINGINFIVT